jgi:hypothetical protein
MRTLRRSSLLLALTLFACNTPAPIVVDGGNDAQVTGDAGNDAGTPAECAPSEVTCVDQSITMLDLFDTVAPGVITEEGTTAGEFSTHIDATAGVMPGGTMPTQGFVYARFTDTGLEKVDISDEDAFASTDWDIAFRRYVIRLNSGVSGPSCVTGARTAPGTLFADLTAVPEGLTQRVEEYFGASCEYVTTDGVGSPSTALSSYYEYASCLQMNDNVYVVTRADGRHVKLEMLSYYTPENQTMCNETGAFTPPSGAGNMRIRWAFLD